MNCKFKFHLRAALYRGAAGPVGSAEVSGPTGVPGGAPPDFQVCGSRSETELFGFAGKRARTGPAGGLLFFGFSGPRFALENRVHWLCGQAGANRAGRRPPFSGFSGLRFALKNRVLWLCGQAGANRAGRRPPSFGFSGLRFALENRVNWLCGQAGANRAGLRAAFRLKRDARKAPSASVHLFPLLFFQKERIDDEFTLSPRRRQFPPLLRDRSKLEVFHEYLYGGSQQRFRSNSYS